MATAGNSRQQQATVGNSPVATSGEKEWRDLKCDPIRLAPVLTHSVVDRGKEGELVCRLNLWRNAGLKYTEVGLGSRRDSRCFCGGNPCATPV
jgi:hypothetical protein